jgi:hypothetical protein
MEMDGYGPLNELLKRFLDDEANLVLDAGNVGGIGRSCAGRHLIVGESLALAVAQPGITL